MTEYIALYIILIVLLCIYGRKMSDLINVKYNTITDAMIPTNENTTLNETYQSLLEKRKQVIVNDNRKKQNAQIVQTYYDTQAKNIESIKEVYNEMNSLHATRLRLATHLCHSYALSKEKKAIAGFFEEKSKCMISKLFEESISKNTKDHISTYLARLELTSLPSEGNALSIEL